MDNTNLPPQLPVLDEACRKAITYLGAGRVDAAETVLRAVLQAMPQHALANYQLGLLLLQSQPAAVALPYFLVALEESPETATYWLAYIETLIQAEELDSAREVLVLGKSHGLEGEAIEALTSRLQAMLVSATTPVEVKKTAQPEAAQELALIAFLDQGRFAEGVEVARAMTAKFPRHGFGWKVLGALLRSQGDSVSALAPTQKSVQLLPRDAQAQTNLGLVLSDLGKLKASAACHRRALALDPGFADAHNNLATALKLQGRLADAEASYRRALKLRPDYAEAYNNLGVTLYDLKRYAEAEHAYLQALALCPNYVEAFNNLGNVLVKQLRPAEAEKYLRQALVFRPDYADAHYNLAGSLREQGRLDEAVVSFRQALALSPSHLEALLNLGLAYSKLGRLDDAVCCYRGIIAIDSSYVDAHNSLGVVLRHQGRLVEAEESYRQALMLQPERADLWSNLLFNHCCLSERSVSSYLEDAYRYGSMLRRISKTRFTTWKQASPSSRLRVGMVSGDLRNHAVGYWLESLISHIDPASIELIAYPTTSQFDELSARMAQFFSAWKPLTELSDDEAARMIHADGVQILIDVSGHTAGTRLPLFAAKPAPIQVSWLGYFASTGVKEIDYLIGDRFVTPESEATHFVEMICRMPESYLCFTPPNLTLEVGLLPALRVGHITFGCFNNLAKMNDDVVALWARVLKSIPQSQLFLKTDQFNDENIKRVTAERFAGFGVSSERLIMEGKSPRPELLAAYQRVDIALDPFPYPGGTTSAEAMWMGVPLITRRGDRFLSHMGESIVHNAGLADWIAEDDDDYVAKAVYFAGDLGRLAVIRSSLRQQALASPLFDGPRFARNFEAALWGMWEKWAAKQGVLQ